MDSEGEREAEGLPEGEVEDEALPPLGLGVPGALREGLGRCVKLPVLQAHALELAARDEEAQLLAEGERDSAPDVEGDRLPLRLSDTHCEELGLPLTCALALRDAEPEDEGHLLLVPVLLSHAEMEDVAQGLRVRGTVPLPTPLGVGFARLPLPQGVTVQDCEPELQPDREGDALPDPEKEGLRVARAEALRDRDTVRQAEPLRVGVPLLEAQGEEEGEREGEPQAEAGAEGESEPRGLPLGEAVAQRDAVAQPETLRLPPSPPLDREGEPLLLGLAVPHFEVLGEAQADATPLIVEAGLAVVQTLLERVSCGEALEEAVPHMVPVPVPRGDCVFAREGEVVADPVPQAVGGREADTLPALLRDTDPLMEAEPLDRGEALLLLQAVVQPLCVPAPVADAERQREGDAVPVEQPVPRPVPLSDAETEGEGEAEGEPLPGTLPEALRLGDLLPMGEAEPRGDGVGAALREALSVMQGETDCDGEPDGEPLTSGVAEALGQPLGDRVVVTAGVLVRERVGATLTDVELLRLAVPEPLCGALGEPQALVEGVGCSPLPEPRGEAELQAEVVTDPEPAPL